METAKHHPLGIGLIDVLNNVELVNPRRLSWCESEPSLQINSSWWLAKLTCTPKDGHDKSSAFGLQKTF